MRHLVFSIALLLAAASIHAQTPLASGHSPVGGRRPSTVTSRLTATLETWDASARGPLLVVDPDRVMPPGLRIRIQDPTWTNGLSMPVLPGEGATMAEVIAYYGLQPARFGTLSALVPAEMPVVNTHLGKPNLLKGVQQDAIMRLLGATLTPNQWRALGSAQGLGLDNLSSEQGELFLALLPETFRQLAGHPLSAGEPAVPPVELSREDRARVRIRMSREIDLAFPSATRPDSWEGGGFGHARGDPSRWVAARHMVFGQATYGAEFTQYQPNRQKRSQLRFDALAAPISLQPDEGSPTLTVAALVQRAARSDELELYADPRVAALPVWTAGSSSRAGDVLKALCLALCGTFRKVGPAYVLTEDIEPLGPRLLLQLEWWDDARAEAERIANAAARAVAAYGGMDAIGFSEHDLPVPADRLKALEEPDLHPYPPKPGYVPRNEFAVNQLSPSWQARIRDQVARVNQQRREMLAHMPESMRVHFGPASEDRVRISVMLNLQYVLPNGDTVADLEFNNPTTMTHPSPYFSPQSRKDSQRPDTFNLPAEPGDRALLLAPATPEEAAQAAREAHRRGFTQLWVRAPDLAAAAIIATAVKAGKEAGVSVTPVVSPLWRPLPNSLPPEQLDCNIAGESSSAHISRRRDAPVAPGSTSPRPRFRESGDYLRADEPSAAAEVQRLVLQIAAVPGIVGLAFTGTTPSGYELDVAGPYRAADPPAGWDLGYTPRLRLACMRECGLDPADLGRCPAPAIGPAASPFRTDQELRPYTSLGADGRPLPRPARAPTQFWNSVRAEANAGLMKELFGAVRAAQPALPLMTGCGGGASSPWELRWIVSWERPGALAGRYLPIPLKPEYEMAREAGTHPMYCISHSLWSGIVWLGPNGFEPLPDDPRHFGDLLYTALRDPSLKRWDGFVLDLSDVSVSRALELLSSLATGEAGMSPPAAES